MSTRFAIGPVRHSEPIRNEAASEADQIRPGKLSLALAGGYAIQAHGIGSRASGDMDLFVNWARQDDFDDAVNAVIGALEAEGMEVTVVVRAETFARLLVTDPSVVLTNQPGKTHRPARAIGQAVKLPSRAIDRVETILMLQRDRTLIHLSPGDRATSHSR